MSHRKEKQSLINDFQVTNHHNRNHHQRHFHSFHVYFRQSLHHIRSSLITSFMSVSHLQGHFFLFFMAICIDLTLPLGV